MMMLRPGLVASAEERPVASAGLLLDNGTSDGGSVAAADDEVTCMSAKVCRRDGSVAVTTAASV